RRPAKVLPAAPRLANFLSGPLAAPERPLPPGGRSRRPREEALSLSLSRGMNDLISTAVRWSIRWMRTGDDARALHSKAHSHAKPASTFAEEPSSSRTLQAIRGMTAASLMDLALKVAEKAGKSGEVPIGCVIVRGNEVIATAGNRTLADRDPTAHAEIVALREAGAAIGSERLVDCDLYVTLEPCTMCAGAISLARIRRLYYGAADPKGGAVESGVRFFASPPCHHAPEIYSAVGERAAATLLQDFFRARR